MKYEKIRIGKKKVKMKGINIPRFFYSCAGWIDQKRNLIIKKDDMSYSPFLGRKQHDFETYCSAVYRITSENLKNFRVKRCEIRQHLLTVRQKLEENTIKLMDEIPDTVSGRRYEASLHMENRHLQEEYMEVIQKLNEIKITIENTELDMQEMLHGTKSRAEASLLAYLQGAGISGEVEWLLREDTIAKDLYYECCGFNYMIDGIAAETEREGDMDEAVR